MSDMAYIMETQDPRELWLVEGEDKFRVSRDMYWLLVSQGADLPRAHDISELLAENVALRELVSELWEGYNDPRCEECHLKDTPTCADCHICAREALVIDRMRELGIEVVE